MLREKERMADNEQPHLSRSDAWRVLVPIGWGCLVVLLVAFLAFLSLLSNFSLEM